MKVGHATEKRLEKREKSRLRENVEAILLAIVIALFIRTFVVQAFKIPSGSMKQTLLIGDHILVNKFIYGVKLPLVGKTLVPLKDPRRGDIIVFKFPEDPKKDFIKRVVGVAGDIVEIKNKQVYVNGKPENHAHGVHMDAQVYSGLIQPRDNYGPVTIPPDSLFVLGDNRDQSYDSRFWGFVNQKAVKGKAFIVYWSWDKKGFGVRWRRIAKLLH